MEKRVTETEVVAKADVKIAICETCPGHDMCERIDCNKLRAIDNLWSITIRIEGDGVWQ